MSDARPVDCRFRLQDEGKPYPRSSCSGCGRTITTGLGKSCHRVPAVADLQRQLSEAVERAEKAEGWARDWHGIVDTICVVLGFGSIDAQDAVAAIRAKFEQAERERDEARELVAEANNSLYGSKGYFHSLDGGEFDKHHLSRGVENLKERARKAYLLPVYRDMLGPKGKQVADLWEKQGVQRVHFDWGPDAPTGEERADFILSLNLAPRTEVADVDAALQGEPKL